MGKLINKSNNIVSETILIVEDEHLIANDLNRKLQSFGYSTLIAHDGITAIKLIKENNPDLILMDIILEGQISGIEVVEKIQKFYPIPVIYLTALIDDETLSHAKKTMPLGYMVKPYKDHEIKAMIELALYKSKVEKKFYEAELKYNNLVDTAGIAIMINDTDGNIRFCNSYLADILGFSLSEIKKMTIEDFAHPDDIETIMNHHRNIINGENLPLTYEVRCFHKDGSIKYLQVNTSLFNEKGQVVGTKSYIWDITDKVLMSKKLEESEELFRSMIEQSNDGMIILNQKGQIIEWNKGQEVITGYSRSEVIGQQYADIQYNLLQDELKTEETREFIKSTLKSFFLTANAQWLGKLQELTIKNKSGKKKYIQQMPFILKTSKSFLLCNISRDLTVQHEADKLLRKSEERYRRLFDSYFEAILLSNMNDRIIKVNLNAAKMLGIKNPEDLIGVKIKDLYLNPENREEHFRMLKESEMIDEFSIKLKKMDGSNDILNIIGSAVVIKDEDDEPMVEAVFRDISKFIK